MRRFKMGRRPARGRRILLVLFVLAAVTAVFAEARLPAVKAELQQAALSAWGQEQIAKTVEAQLPESTASESGSLVSLDTYELSTLKTALTAALQSALTGKATAWVPVGNLTGVALFNGRGFKVPVSFSVDGVVSVDFESTLVSAGINRTKYAVTMTVAAELYSTSVCSRTPWRSRARTRFTNQCSRARCRAMRRGLSPLAEPQIFPQNYVFCIGFPRALWYNNRKRLRPVCRRNTANGENT